MKCFPRQQRRSANHGFVTYSTTGGAREGTHIAIVTWKAMILGNQGPALSSTDEEGAEFQRLRIIVQSGDGISQRVMTKKCFG